ncbi:MAG: lipopolysaccharide biosynthesis protein [Desulfobacterales bacterium]
MTRSSHQKTTPNTRHQSIVLGVSNMIVSLVMFLSPVILTRVLGKSDFADFRLLWLLANTAQLLAPLGLPNSLMYFLPRVDAEERAHFVTQTVLVLIITGSVAAYLASPYNPFLPEKFHFEGLIVPVFIVVWVVSKMLELLPTADLRVDYQAFSLISTSAFRLIVIVGVAFLTNDIHAVFKAVLALGLFKLILLIFYIFKWHGIRVTGLKLKRVTEQLGYALPFGLTAIVNNLRRQLEQWIVAFMFVPEAFAVFSIGAMELPILALVRQTLGHVIFPRMSKAHAKGDYGRILYLNQSANLATAFLVFPISAFILIFAEPLVTLLFSEEYAGTAIIFQVYLGVTIFRVIDVANIMMIFSQKLFVAKVSLSLLFLSVLLSYFGAKTFGMAGAALGSLSAQAIYTVATYIRACKLLNVGFGALQEWKGFAHAASGSLCAVGAAWLATQIVDAESWLLARLVVAGLFTFSIYLVYLKIFGYDWVIAAFLNREKWGDKFKREEISE